MKQFYSMLLSALVSLGLTGCTVKTPDPILAPLVEKGVARGYPGFAVAVQKSDGSIRSAVAGLSNIEQSKALTINQPFHIGSITKTFTAVLTLHLIDEGKLTLDTTLYSVLGETVKGIPHVKQITVAQLLDHSSGIYATNNDLDYISSLLGPAADPKRIYSPTELIALADGSKQEPTGKPGEEHSYSDSNYTLLGLIVEKRSGKPFKDYAAEVIFDPLEMDETYFYSDQITGKVKPSEEIVQGYLIATEDIRGIIDINPMFGPIAGAERKEGALFNTTLASERVDAAGGIISTIPDLLLFGSALFRGKLLSPSSQSFLTASGKGMAALEIGENRTWTLQAAHKPYGVILYKQGDGPGGTTELLAYLPEQDLIFAGFTNSFGYFDEVDFMLDEIIAAIAKAE